MVWAPLMVEGGKDWDPLMGEGGKDLAPLMMEGGKDLAPLMVEGGKDWFLCCNDSQLGILLKNVTCKTILQEKYVLKY